MVHTEGKFLSIFMQCAPESVLPFPKDTLGIALQTMAKHHHKSGNVRGVRLMQQVGISLSMLYKDDEEALLRFAKAINEPKGREAILSILKTESQKNWSLKEVPEYDPNEKWDGTI
jgi:hypothetical protein